MLRELCIDNIAVIEHAELQLQPGFTVLSGETGAGKSIIIDSLNAILGGRVSRDLIRTGQTKAVVTAVFSGLSQAVAERFAALGVEVAEGELMLRREMFADGRNLCRVNGQTASLQLLKELGVSLVAIHGQHDGQHLLDEQLHMEYLDDFARLGPDLAGYEREFEELLSLNRRMKSMSMSAAEKQRRRDVLAYQINELEQAAVKVGEQDALREKRLALVHAEKISDGLREALALLSGSEEQDGAADQLTQSETALRRCEKFSTGAGELAARARDLALECAALAQDLRTAVGEAEYSPEALEETETRLDLLERLGRKYLTPCDNLPAMLEQMRTELNELDNLEEDLTGLRETYAAKREQVVALGEVLHNKRVAAAEQLRTAVEQQLKGLDMASALFFPEVEGGQKFNRRGTDAVRFLMSTNSGETLKPLAKIASGGELSRIMLAMKAVLTAGDDAVSVFDEIDAGVSGRAASHVGEKLYAISRDRQVLCVTHLPQIAVLADHQYYISKAERDGRTYTSVIPLDRQGRAEEIARLTAGTHITEGTMESAYQLLDSAAQYKYDLTK